MTHRLRLLAASVLCGLTLLIAGCTVQGKYTVEQPHAPTVYVLQVGNDPQHTDDYKVDQPDYDNCDVGEPYPGCTDGN